MAKNLQKSLKDYLSKVKRETGKLQLPSSSIGSSKRWVMSACKHPRTLSISENVNKRKPSSEISDSESEISKTKNKSKRKEVKNDSDSAGHAATLSDIDRFLEENFKSLSIREDEEDEDSERDQNKSDEDDDDDRHDVFSKAWSPALYDSPVRRSETRRSTGTASTTTASVSEDMGSSSNSSAAGLPENCIAVPRYSPDPQEEFRSSMMEMVEARETEADWEFMEELLLCYLDLNEKRSHKYILSAFVDIIMDLRGNEDGISRTGLIRSLSSRLVGSRLSRRKNRPF